MPNAIDDEFWFPWLVGWKLVEALTIREAACILSHVDPAPYRYGNRILPSEVDAMEAAIGQAILLGKLKPFAMWMYCPLTSDVVPCEEASPHTNLDPQRTSVRVAELVEWADARSVPHCWQSATARKDAGTDWTAYPPELRAAIEAFNAVHGNLRATAGKSPKKALEEWLTGNKPELSAGARERIATVANWQREGGAPKTPG